MQKPSTIVITGASRGIGLLTARTLAARGCHVIATMRDVQGRNASVAKQLQEWAQNHHHSLQVLELDVTQAEQVQQLVTEIEQRQPIDVLINNAGTMPCGLTEAFNAKQFQQCFDVNLFGIVNLTHAVLPTMRQRRQGLLIHFSSAAGRLAIPYFGLYCASKWALEGYAESLQLELQPYGIKSVIIEPSGHATELVSQSPAPADQQRLREYGEHAAGRDKLLGMFDNAFAEQQPITNAQNIADLVADVVFSESPRALRYQIGDDMGVDAINQATRAPQAALIEQLRPVYSTSAA